MIPKTVHGGERLVIRSCRTDGFKAGRLTLSIVQPIQRDAYLTSLLFSVLLRGTENYPSVSLLNQRLDYLYGTEFSLRNSYRGDCHVVGFSVDLLNDEYLGEDAGTLLPALCDLMAEVLYRPYLDASGIFDARYVESEKQLMCDAIRSQKKSPSAYTAKRLGEMLYADEPCGIDRLGTEEAVMAVTPEMLTAHWHALLDTLSIEIFHVGSAADATLLRAVRGAFDAPLALRGRKVPTPHPVGEAWRVQQTRTGEDTLAVKQGHLAIGLRAPRATICDDSFYACMLFNELLGGSPVSKVFMNVREKHGLCYSCSSSYNAYKGVVKVTCGLENENRAVAEKEILCQVGEIADGNFTDAEWEAARKSLVNAYRQMTDSPRALESFYFGRMLAGVEAGIDASIAAILAVTRAEVMALAASFVPAATFFLRADPTALGGEEEYDEED